MTVFAFDIDGTLETSAGPVTTAQLRKLHRRGHFVYLVSPSAARPKGFPIIPDTGREQNLRAVRAMHPDESNFVYVSDNGDNAAADAAGFLYVDRNAFKEGR